MPLLPSSLHDLDTTSQSQQVPREVPKPAADQKPTSSPPVRTSNKPGPIPSFGPAGSSSFNQPETEKFRSCSGTSRAGHPCAAPPRTGHPYCIFHDPEYRQAQRENSSSGGRASGESRRRAEEAIVPIDLTTARSRANLLGYLASGTLTGRISSAKATSLQRTLELVHREDLAESPLAGLLRVGGKPGGPKNLAVPQPSSNFEGQSNVH